MGISISATAGSATYDWSAALVEIVREPILSVNISCGARFGFYFLELFRMYEGYDDCPRAVPVMDRVGHNTKTVPPFSKILRVVTLDSAIITHRSSVVDYA